MKKTTIELFYNIRQYETSSDKHKRRRKKGLWTEAEPKGTGVVAPNLKPKGWFRPWLQMSHDNFGKIAVALFYPKDDKPKDESEPKKKKTVNANFLCF